MAKRTAKKRAPRAKMAHGRPQFFGDPAQAEAFITWMNSGCTRADACRKVGCARRTIDYAMERDPVFRTRVEEAEANGKLLAILCVTSNAKTNPQIALQYLARKWPNEWAYRKPDVITRQQFKSLIDQLIATLINVVPPEFHPAINGAINNLLLSVIGGQEQVEGAADDAQV